MESILTEQQDVFPIDITALVGKKYAFKVSIDEYGSKKMLPVFTMLRFFDDPEIIESNRPSATPTKQDIEATSSAVLTITPLKFPREEMVYLSCDSVDKTEGNAAVDQSIFSQEFINGLKFSDVPNHRLALKVGVPIMLLRNINQPNGLCNGTRMQVLKLTRTSISA
ncbi:ATP-dependent DNA helicase PIF1-like protein [Tanacetum coccineum]